MCGCGNQLIRGKAAFANLFLAAAAVSLRGQILERAIRQYLKFESPRWQLPTKGKSAARYWRDMRSGGVPGPDLA